MKLKIKLLLALLLVTQNSFTQIPKMYQFYDSIKYYDLSKLWRSDSILNLEYVDDTFYRDPRCFSFPEPLGFIGNNYQRFYIHFISVKKDKKNPYQYNIAGKTKVKNNICGFKGKLIIDTAYYIIDSDISAQFKSGHVKCHCVFYEDSAKYMSGYISGTMGSDWLIYQNKLYYNSTYFVADGYCNNQFKGVWTSYKGNVKKKCNWGDFRIPDSGELDGGAGEFSPTDKYENNGWQNYRNAWLYGDDSIKQSKAQQIENEQWWK